MSETVDVDAWEASERALAEPRRLSDWLDAAMRHGLLSEQDPYDGSRLRVGRDLKPAGDCCDRQTFYGLTNATRDEPAIRDLQRLDEGKEEEERLARALRLSGHEIETQGLVHPLRPSFWAWWPGHFDILVKDKRTLLEVKVTSADRFDMAGSDYRRLITPSHRHQLSLYHHELKRQGRIDSSSWVVYNREHKHDPVEVPLTDDMLVPLEEIVRLEVEKARLLGLTEPPPRAPSVLEVSVWKRPAATEKSPELVQLEWEIAAHEAAAKQAGRGEAGRAARAKRDEAKARAKALKGTSVGRRVEAVERRYALCSFCNYQGVCQPGPEERPVTLTATDARALEAVRRAEAAWAAGEKTTPQRSSFDAEVDHGQAATPEVAASEAAVPGVLPAVAEPRADVPAQAAVVAGLGAALLTREAVASVALDKGPYQTVVSIEGVVEAEPFRNEDGRLCPLCDGLYGHAHPQSRCVKCGAVGLAENMSGPTAMHVCAPPAHSPENNGAGALPSPAADAPLSTPIADPVPSSSDPSAASPSTSNGAAPPAAPEATPPRVNSPTSPPPAAACSSPPSEPEAWEDDEPETVTAAQDDYLKDPEW